MQFFMQGECAYSVSPNQNYTKVQKNIGTLVRNGGNFVKRVKKCVLNLHN